MKVTNQSISKALTTGKTESSAVKENSDKNLSEIKKSNSNQTSQLASSAKVNLSERAQMMQKAKDIASESSVDEAKVAHFQKLIDQGKYNIDAEAVADRLVDEHLTLS